MTIRFETLASRVAATLLAVLLTACASFDSRVPADTQVDAAKLGATPSPIVWPRDDWWTRYGDVQLDALVAEGLAGSPTLAGARARIAKADAAAGVSRAALLPQVSGNGAGAYQRYSENYIFPPPLGGTWQTDARATLDFSFEFDFWDKNGAALRSALSQAQSAEADAETARVTLTASIARAYFNLQRLFAQRDVSLAALTQREDIVRITNERFTAGLDTRVEVRQADAALATVRTELAQYEDAIVIARNQLAALVGAGPDRGQAISAVKLAARRHPRFPRRSRSTSSAADPRSSRRAGASMPRRKTSRSPRRSSIRTSTSSRSRASRRSACRIWYQAAARSSASAPLSTSRSSKAAG